MPQRRLKSFSKKLDWKRWFYSLHPFFHIGNQLSYSYPTFKSYHLETTNSVSLLMVTQLAGCVHPWGGVMIEVKA